MQRADGNDDRRLRRDLSAGDRLQQRYELCRGDDRIDRALGHRAVTALSDELDLEAVGRRKEGVVAHADLARVEPRVKMKREGAIDVRILHGAVVDHQLVSGVAFFARLKAKDDLAADVVAPAHELARRR